MEWLPQTSSKWTAAASRDFWAPLRTTRPARPTAALHVHELALREELAADVREPIPGHARVILRPLTRAAAELVRRDREGCQRRSLPNEAAAIPSPLQQTPVTVACAPKGTVDAWNADT